MQLTSGPCVVQFWSRGCHDPFRIEENEVLHAHRVGPGMKAHLTESINAMVVGSQLPHKVVNLLLTIISQKK